MYRAMRRTIAAAAAVHRDSANVVVQLRKPVVPAPGQHDQEREPEALAAALSLGAVFLTILTSLAIRFWL